MFDAYEDTIVAGSADLDLDAFLSGADLGEGFEDDEAVAELMAEDLALELGA